MKHEPTDALVLLRYGVPVRILGLFLAFIILSCGEDAASPTEEPTPGQPNQTAALLAEVDARVVGEALERALSSTDPEARELGMRGVARLHDPANLPALRLGLADPNPSIRSAASLGLGALEDLAPPEVERALLGGLAAERDPAVRADMLFDLGRVGSEASEGALRVALSDPEAATREGACRGVGNLGLRRRAPEAALLRRVGFRAHDDPDPAVRLACAYALSRVPPPGPLSEEHAALRADLSAAAADPDAEVRAMAVRALGRYADLPSALLEERATDTDWQVRIQALRVLAHPLDAAWDGALTRATRRALDEGLEGPLEGPKLHVLITALEACAGRPEAPTIVGVAQEAFERLGTVARGEPLSRDRGLAHCAAARLIDLGRRWPSRVENCGLEQVLPWERQVLAASVIARVAGAEAQRVAYVRRLFATDDVRVKEAALQAAAQLLAPGATALVLRGLRSEDTGVVTAACDAVVAATEGWAAPVAPVPILSIRPAGSPEPPPPASAAPTEAQLRRGLRAAWRTLSAADDLEGTQSWLQAVVKTRSLGFLPRLRGLLSHPNFAVRRSAEQALETLGEERRREPARQPIEGTLPQSEFATPAPQRIMLDTDRGRVIIELLADEAPSTVRRIAALARDGFYEDLTFHRVVTGFVAQGGDPRGDGYGGPGWSQRCEDNRVRYVRGTVGMALAGRDTGGSQFFITHSTQPHLDARYTAFGRVTDGMNVVDRLQAGDRIRSATVE